MLGGVARSLVCFRFTRIGFGSGRRFKTCTAHHPAGGTRVYDTPPALDFYRFLSSFRRQELPRRSTRRRRRAPRLLGRPCESEVKLGRGRTMRVNLHKTVFWGVLAATAALVVEKSLRTYGQYPGDDWFLSLLSKLVTGLV